jgi:hypothetical protein
VDELRERELKETCGEEIHSGRLSVHRFMNTSDSAWQIVDAILDKFEGKTAVQTRTNSNMARSIQLLPNASLGKTLRYSLHQFFDMKSRVGKDQEKKRGDGQAVVRLGEGQDATRMPKTLKQAKKHPLPPCMVALLGLSVSPSACGFLIFINVSSVN